MLTQAYLVRIVLGNGRSLENSIFASIWPAKSLQAGPPPLQHVRPQFSIVGCQLACPTCGCDIRLIAFINGPGPIRKILTHLGEPLEPPPILPARGPPTDWGELVQADDDRDVLQACPDELPAIDIHSL